MFQERARTLQGFALGLDALCICGAFCGAVVARMMHDSLPLLGRLPSEPWTPSHLARSDYAILLAANLFIWLAYLRRSGLYVSGDAHRSGRVARVYLKALALTIICSAAVVFALKMDVSRLFFAYLIAFQIFALSFKQASFARLVRRTADDTVHRRNALVVGSVNPAKWFAGIVREAEHHGYRLAGVVLPDHTFTCDALEIPVVGTLGELDHVLAYHPVDEVFIVGTAAEMARFGPVAQELIERGRIVSLVSTMSSGGQGVRGRVTNFKDIPMISYGPMPRDGVQSTLTRAIDVGVSALALIVAAPLLLMLASLIKILDPGPVLFSQDRLGHNGQTFRLYKLRTMRRDAEEVLRADAGLYRRYVENDFKLPDNEDPRISRLGRFLRKSSLDELPQLWNILAGDMSLVGPRPIVPAELPNYQPYEGLLLSVKPGLTGQWQANGRSDVRYPERAWMDLDYVGQHSVLADLSIMARTVPSVIRRRGAH